jgi:hypothetical protein
MTTLSIIALVIAGIIGMFIGHPLSKSAGRREGAQQAAQEQEVAQAKVIRESVQERNDVEANVAATPRADIDSELSEFSRPD